MQQPPFMIIAPGDLKVEFVYINWTAITASGWWSTHRPIGLSSDFTSEESNHSMGKGLVAPSPFGRVPNSLMVREYEPGREDHEFDPRLGNFFLVRWKKK